MSPSSLSSKHFLAFKTVGLPGLEYFPCLLLRLRAFLLQLVSLWAKDAPCFSSCATHLEPGNPHLIILMHGSDIHLLLMRTICTKNGSSPRPSSLFPNPCQQQEEAVEYQCSPGLWLLVQEPVVLKDASLVPSEYGIHPAVNQEWAADRRLNEVSHNRQDTESRRTAPRPLTVQGYSVPSTEARTQLSSGQQ